PILHRDDRHDRTCALDLRDRYLGEAHVTNLAFRLKVPERSELILCRHGGIDPVQLIQVDAIDAKTAKTALAGSAQMIGPAVRRPDIGTRALEPRLRRDHEAGWIRMQRPADEPLAHLGTVRIGRVDEVDAQVE